MLEVFGSCSCKGKDETRREKKCLVQRQSNSPDSETQFIVLRQEVGGLLTSEPRSRSKLKRQQL